MNTDSSVLPFSLISARKQTFLAGPLSFYENFLAEVWDLPDIYVPILFYPRIVTMAKGLRASTKKANRSKLRSKVFEPVEDARTERLSAKLLEITLRPRPRADEEGEKGQNARAVQQGLLGSRALINVSVFSRKAAGRSARV